MQRQAETLYPRVRENVKFRLSPSLIEIQDLPQRAEFELAENAWEVYQKCDGKKASLK